MFLLHNFRPCLIKQMIFVPIQERAFLTFAGSENLKTEWALLSKRFPGSVITSVSFGKRVLTRFTVAWKHCIRYSLKLRDLEQNLVIKLSRLWVINLCSLCICFSLLYTLPTRFPWYFRIPRRIDPSNFLVQSDKLVLGPSFSSRSWIYSGEAGILRNCSSSRVRVGRRRNDFCRIVRWMFQWIGCRTTVWHQFPQYHPDRQLFVFVWLTRILLSSILLGS